MIASGAVVEWTTVETLPTRLPSSLIREWAMMVILMSIVVTPMGVLAAIYLREYARQGPVVRLVRICVNNRLTSNRDKSVTSSLRNGDMNTSNIGPEEDPRTCLLREVQEELDMVVTIHTALPPVSHSYPFFGVTLHPYICTAGSNQFTLTEHAEAAWLQPEELSVLDWAKADVPVLHAYLSWLEKERP